MEKKYKDILIVRCRPKSREPSADRPVDTTCHNGITNGTTKQINGITNGTTEPINGITNGITNGTTKQINGTTKQINGTTQQINGITNSTTKQINGITNGTTKQINGITNGTTKQINGITNGTTKQIDDTTKQINGLSNGISQQVNDFTKSINGLTENINGITQKSNGITKNTNGITRKINGISKSLNGVTQINGVAQNLNRLSHNINGLAHSVNGILPNNDQIHGIKSKLNGVATYPTKDVNHNTNGFTNLPEGGTANKVRCSRRATVDLPLENCVNSSQFNPNASPPRVRGATPSPRSVSHSPSRQLTRKISAPSAITFTSGGFHCDGRVPRDDYLPEYIRLLEASDARSNKVVDSIKSVPVSPFSSRRHFQSAHTKQQPPLARPTRSSVTVLTESPQFVRNTDHHISWGTGFNNTQPEHHLAKLSTRNRNPRLVRSTSNTPFPSHPSSDIQEEVWTPQPSVPCLRQTATIGNNSSSFPRLGRAPAPDAASNMTSSEEARDIILMLQSVKPVVGPLPGYENDKTPRYLVGVCMDECYPGLYIGGMGAAKDRAYLNRVGVTHVLNTAEGNHMCTVDTDSQFYKEVGIEYLGLQLLDVPSANISQYFEKGAAFIDNCLNNGGKVLVHCFMGISRSSTIAASFLMQKRGMTALEALTTLRQHRSIYPNDGFLHQLVDLDKKLRKERGKP